MVVRMSGRICSNDGHVFDKRPFGLTRYIPLLYFGYASKDKPVDFKQKCLLLIFFGLHA
jgi:hypothetical protein